MSQQTIFNVQPTDYLRVIKKVEVSNVSIILFDGATFNVVLRDEDGVYISNTTLFMNQTTYLEWNNNDDFAKNWILQQLNLTPAPEP